MYFFRMIILSVLCEFMQGEEGVLNHEYAKKENCDVEDCSYHGICNGDKKYFACNCFEPFYGRRCEYEVVEVNRINIFKPNRDRGLQKECTYEDCNNRGTCLGTRLAPYCICNVGYSGWRCEKDMPCDPLIHCSGRGNCLGERDRFVCFCKFGFFGAHCQHTVLDITHSKGLVHAEVN